VVSQRLWRKLGVAVEKAVIAVQKYVENSGKM
jgi:hypothetical protein